MVSGPLLEALCPARDLKTKDRPDGSHVGASSDLQDRVALVRLMLEESCSERAAAARLAVAPATAHHWKRQVSAEAGVSGAHRWTLGA